MKKLILSLTLLCSVSALAGIPYLITPTNAPGLVGQQLFSTGTGYSWWDWGTNAASSNSTVVSASASIGVTTNGFNFTPFLSAAVTNWINAQDTVVSNGVYGLFNGGTNAAFGYSRTIGGLATNRVDYASNLLWLKITNTYVAAGANVTVTTNRSGQDLLLTIAASGTGGGGSVTNGALVGDVTKPDNSGTTTLATVNANTGSFGDGANVPQITVNGKGLITAAGTTPVAISGSQITSGTVDDARLSANVPLLNANNNWSGTETFNGTVEFVANASFDGTLSVNDLVVTNGLSDIFTTNSFTRRFHSRTNGFMNVANALDFGLSTSGDMSAVIQATIDSITNVGGIAFIPAGTYSVGGGADIIRMRDGVILMGEAPVAGSGGNGTILNLGNAAGPAIMGPPGKGELKNITIRAAQTSTGIGFMSHTNTTTPTQNFKLDTVNTLTISNGFVLNYCWTIPLVNCGAFNCVYGLIASNQVNAINVRGGHWAQCQQAFRILGLNYTFTISKPTTIELAATGVFASSGVPGGQQNLDISAYFENNTNQDISVTSISGLHVHDTPFIEGTGGAHTNIVVVGTSGFTIDNNVFVDATSSSWHVDATSTQGNIIGNVGSATAIARGVNAATTSYYRNSDVVLTGGAYYGDAKGETNLVMVLNTNLPGAAFKVIGANGGSAAYVTNLTGNITLAAFDLTGARADSVWSIFIHAVADSSSRTVTMPAGVVGSGLALPCVFTVTNAQSANFQITGITGQWTNVAWMPVY